ncbi:VUT family protein [Actinokineospora sp. G85]|uniref:VUT family protein n=1 Tax=Actinokineospora sp. G85 TaxID=3406626 RepID=UPI003C741FD0
MSAATTTMPVPTATTKLMVRSVASGPSMVLGVAAMVGYLLSVVAANAVSVHWSPLAGGGLLIPAGTLFAGVSLTARDLLHDVCGPRGVAADIMIGTGVSAVLASPQIAVASVVAFSLSEVLDAAVYARVRHRTRLGAVAVSNAVGLVVDSAVFVPLAFGDIAAVPGQILGKTAATVCTLLALHTASRVVRP